MNAALQDLLDRISAALRSLPGATELYLFGSAADPARADQYSDLDLQVVSEDYDLSLAAWPWILSLAGDLTLVYPLVDASSDETYTISLAGESLYHKLDIGLSAAGERLPFTSDEAHILLWRQPVHYNPTAYPATGAYLPEAGSAAHYLVGQLLGAVRYVKARKRGQQLLCWRYMGAAVNSLLRCYLWDGDPLRFPVSPLAGGDYAALDRILPALERRAFFADLDLRTAEGMNHAFFDTLRRIAACTYPDYFAGDAPLANLIREYLAFTADELGLTE
ncbi:MAG: nucleotidyltransferase domain-containing protein [Anaerolineae bacterium]